MMERLREKQLTRPIDLLYAFTCDEEARNMAGDEVADMRSKAKQSEQDLPSTRDMAVATHQRCGRLQGQLQRSLGLLRV